MPQVVGFKLTGKLPEGATATDLVLTVTQMLREKGVVGKFVEFYGEGLSSLPLPDRATIANMAPEYGATCGFFPVDNETIRYLSCPAATTTQMSNWSSATAAQRAGHVAQTAERPPIHCSPTASSSTSATWCRASGRT